MWWSCYIFMWINHNCSLMITPVSDRYRSDYQIWLCLTVCIVRRPKEVSTIAIVAFKSSEIRKESHDDKLAATVVNRQLRSYANSYDHASLFVSCSYDHCNGAVTIILPEIKTTILLISYGYRVFSLVTTRTTTNDKSILSANYVCLRGMQESQSDPARTHRRRRPPSCMIVTAMIVTVSP